MLVQCLYFQYIYISLYIKENIALKALIFYNYYHIAILIRRV